MKFLDYIKGQRKGKDANDIERQSIYDPFLRNAIEGFDSINDDHIARIKQIQTRLKNKPAKQRRTNYAIGRIAAAGIAIVLILGGYLLFDNNKTNLYAQQRKDIRLIEIYVPETFYEENKVIIEEKNVVLSENYKPTVENFRVNEILNATVSKEEFDALSKELMSDGNKSILDIYFPDDDGIIPESASGKPEPIIGWGKYKLYLKAAMIRPTDDACSEQHGKVAVDFYVDENGSPYQLEVPYSLCGTSDKEAIRLIKNGPKWTKGKDKVRVIVEF